MMFVDPPPAVDLISTGGDATFSRRNGENIATNTGNTNQGTPDAFVGVNTNTNTAGVDPLADLNAQINTGGASNVVNSGNVNFNTDVQTNPLAPDTTGDANAAVGGITFANQGGSLTSNVGESTTMVGENTVSNNRINTGTFGGNAGLSNQNGNVNAVNVGGTVGDPGRTTLVNVGGTIGNTGRTNVGNTVGGTSTRNNVKTATSGGTVKVANKEGLSASAQNRRPRLPDVTHAECIQNCLSSQYKSSHHCLFANQCQLDPSLRSYRDRSLQYVDPHLNCRTYWQCQNGKSFPYCCPNGQAYREGVGCVDDTSCHDWCCPRNQIFVEGVGCREMPHTICYEKCCPADVDFGSCLADSVCLDDCVRDLNYQVTNCPLSPVPGDNKKFSINDNGQIYQMPCGHGTVYMQEKCACVPGTGDPSVGMDCRPTVHVDFNKDKVENSRQTHVYFHNITSTKNFGKFGRGSRAQIDFYKGNSGVLYNIFIELRFYDSNRYNKGRLVGPDVQVLVSNCRIRDKHELSPSIAIRKSWNNVLLRYDGSELYGEVTYQESTGQKKLKTNRKLKTSSVEALSIGSCGSTDYFEGYMDEIWIFDCIPQTQQFPSANAKEIKKIYFISNTIIFYNFSEDTGNLFDCFSNPAQAVISVYHPCINFQFILMDN
ncbi:hypothetical protein KUTeg_008318 [Tegillarca granosa]|uniref:Uncharacterized protein n=1 Tax=Tegillarca granosa TaxID=220873 RepID=A0ABQ9FBK2_TEGGR|nr:hypothetical protein KUTeg_008318 [Tegillarca granosa]